jgi:hypothetical protein
MLPLVRGEGVHGDGDHHERVLRGARVVADRDLLLVVRSCGGRRGKSDEGGDAESDRGDGGGCDLHGSNVGRAGAGSTARPRERRASSEGMHARSPEPAARRTIHRCIPPRTRPASIPPPPRSSPPSSPRWSSPLSFPSRWSRAGPASSARGCSGAARASAAALGGEAAPNSSGVGTGVSAPPPSPAACADAGHGPRRRLRPTRGARRRRGTPAAAASSSSLPRSAAHRHPSALARGTQGRRPGYARARVSTRSI